MIKRIKQNFLNKISNIKGGSFNKNLYKNIKKTIANKLSINEDIISDEVIYLISRDNNEDSYFMKIGSAKNLETRFNDYQTTFINGIYCHGLIFKLKTNEEKIDKIEEKLHKYFSYTKKIMIKRKKAKYSSSALQITPLQPFGEWFWLDSITFYENLDKMFEINKDKKNKILKNTVMILFLEKPILFTEDIYDIDWVKYIFTIDSVLPDITTSKIIKN
jgi:hypothetical protein